jgi:4'-phosphopantetheinyl transferase
MPSPGGSAAVTPGAVDVWLERVDSVGPSATPVGLDDDELARAERFRFARDRERFVARRAFLRRTLARCVGVEPGEITYRVSPLGRPELDPRFGLAFSASHADGLACVAVSRNRLVGVDIERLRPLDDLMELTRSACSPAEALELDALPRAARAEAFLDLWTRKESYVKAIGTGLSLALARVEVGRGSDGPRRVAGSDEPFTFVRLRAPAGWLGSVAASGPGVAVHLHRPGSRA